MCVAVGLHGGLDVGRKWKRSIQILISAVKAIGFRKTNRGRREQRTSVEAGGETNAIKVNQQPELIEIKDQKRGHREGGSGAAFTAARAEWENSAMRLLCWTDISSFVQPAGRPRIQNHPPLCAVWPEPIQPDSKDGH